MLPVDLATAVAVGVIASLPVAILGLTVALVWALREVRRERRRASAAEGAFRFEWDARVRWQRAATGKGHALTTATLRIPQVPQSRAAGRPS